MMEERGREEGKGEKTKGETRMGVREFGCSRSWGHESHEQVKPSLRCFDMAQISPVFPRVQLLQLSSFLFYKFHHVPS